MTVSVLIGTRDRPAALRRCLRSIAKQNRPAEVVVLDDAPQHSPAAGVVQAFPNLDVVYERTTGLAQGVGGTRNRLAQRATGEILCFLDDDAEFVRPDALDRLVEVMEERPRAGALAFRIRNQRNEGALQVPFPSGFLHRRSGRAEEARWVCHFWGAGHALRRSCFQECGGFDEGLHFGEEELDLSFRLLKCGKRIWYEPTIWVDHYPEETALNANEDGNELFHHVRNRLTIAYRHLPLPYALVYPLVWTLVYGGRALKHGSLPSFLRGIKDGIQKLPSTDRSPIPRPVLTYARTYNGRLWY